MRIIVVVKTPFKYMGMQRDRGEQFSFQDSPRDEKLLAIGYVVKFDPGFHKTVHTCPVCSRRFIGDSNYAEHRRKPDCKTPQEITESESKQLAGWAAQLEVRS